MASTIRHSLTAVMIGVLCPDAGAVNNPFLGHDGPIYPNPVTTTWSSAQWGLVQGDFNEDGLQDLAATSSGALTILIGNGDCTFIRGAKLFGGGPVVLGDFNEDNHQDLAVPDEANGIWLYLGNGDGTFALAPGVGVPSVPSNAGAWGLAVADFDENNHDDFVLGFIAPGNPLAFFSGNGNGTFDSATTFSSASVFGIGVADFDENGDLDFIADYSTPTVRLGAGNGMFADAGSFAVGNHPEGLAVFDFDGDSHADFATANNFSDDVSVRLGNGDGTFAAQTLYPVGAQPRFLAVADVDGDGNEDLFASHVYEEYVSLLTGNGDGSFGAEVQIPTAHSPGPMVISDFNKDGRPDLAVASQIATEMAIFQGHGDGTFDSLDPALVRSNGTAGVMTSAFGDVNKDGFRDVVLLRDDGANSITVRVADGTGAFVVSATDAAGLGPSDIAIADVDNDTNPDVLTTNFGSNNVLIKTGNGDGTFEPAYAITVREPVSIATGLLDADGNVDLAVLTTGFGPQVRVLLGTGNGTFAFGGAVSVGPGPTTIEAGDFDEDGTIDLAVVAFDTSELSILIGVGDGTFLPEVRYGPVPMHSNMVFSIADVDADGHQDLLVPYPVGLVLHGLGDGTFGAAMPLGSGDPASAYAVGDANGDGRTDLVSSRVCLELRLEDGTFAPPACFAGDGANAMTLEDTDGDGRNDVILGTYRGVTVLLNVEPSPFNFLGDKATMHWPDVSGALSYNVYRGLISDLTDGDSDGLPDAGYGDCQNGLDPDTTDQQYVDASVPPAGDGYFYLIGVVDWAGERDLGTTSAGLSRVPTSPCP